MDYEKIETKQVSEEEQKQIKKRLIKERIKGYKDLLFFIRNCTEGDLATEKKFKLLIQQDQNELEMLSQ